MVKGISKYNTIQENIMFVLSMYKRELERKDITWEEEEIYQCYIDELETILEADKERNK